MKRRAVSFLLAVLAAFTMNVPAFAAEADVPPAGEDEPGAVDEVSGEEPAVPEEPEDPAEAEETEDTGDAEGAGEEEPAAPESYLYVAGMPVFCGDYEQVDGTNYITVRAAMAILDPEAAVEEADGEVAVSAVAVARVVDLAAAAEDGPEVPAEADVEMETLELSAEAGRRYLMANGRCLYVQGGVRQVNGAVAVPVRVLAQVFNLSVSYDESTGVAALERQGDVAPYLESGETYYDADMLYWLSHIIYSESGNQPLEGMIAVGNVVMNRMASPKFPNDIKSVLFQKNQFSPAATGSIYREPNAQSVTAAKLVLEGAVVLEGVTFFNMTGMRTWARRNMTYVATIGDHDFFA